MYDYLYDLKRGTNKGYDNGLSHRIHSLISVLASLGFLLSLRLFVSSWRLFVSICLSLFLSSYSCHPSFVVLSVRFRLPQSSADRLREDPNRGPAVPKPRVRVRNNMEPKNGMRMRSRFEWNQRRASRQSSTRLWQCEKRRMNPKDFGPTRPTGREPPHAPCLPNRRVTSAFLF